jgi:tetratricopeptide (TPR) repeat protein
MNPRRVALAMLLSAVLVACASTQLPPPAIRTALSDGTTPAQMVTAIRAAGEAAEDELAIRPLRANEVEHLREQATAFEAAGEHAKAAASLDQALATHADDPTVLQERAEAAILLWDFDSAAAFARRAIDVGADVGPLCRRHWATLEHVARARLADPTAGAPSGTRGDAQAQDDAAAQVRTDLEHARQQRDACTVAPPPRY